MVIGGICFVGDCCFCGVVVCDAFVRGAGVMMYKVH